MNLSKYSTELYVGYLFQKGSCFPFFTHCKYCCPNPNHLKWSDLELSIARNNFLIKCQKYNYTTV